MKAAMPLSFGDFLAGSGLLGAGIVILVYFLNQSGRLASDDWRYQGANILGALLIISSLWVNWNLPAFLIEMFWLGISLYGLIRGLLGKKAAG